MPGNRRLALPARHVHRAQPARHGPGRVGHGRRWSWRATPPGSTTSPGSGCSTRTAPSTTPARSPPSRPASTQLASQGAQLVLTDTNRKQAFRWDTLTANSGYTETPSDNPAKTDLSDSPVELFPGTTISSKSYATYVGAVNVTASSYGNSVSYTPEDQAYSAIDDDFDTAWITGTFVPDPKGEWWQSQFADPVTTDHITLVQPQRGDRSRWVSGVTLTFDGKDPVTYDAERLVPRHVGPDADLPEPHVPHPAGDHRRHDERHRSATLGVGGRLLRDRDPRPAGAPGGADAHPDAHQPRHASAADRLTVVMTRQRTSQYPPRERPRDDDHASVHAPDGPHLHPGGQRQPVRPDPRRRGRPPGGPGHDPGQHRPGRVLLGAAAGRRAGDGLGHRRRRPHDGLAARPRHEGAGRLDPDLRPGEAADPQQPGHAGDRRRAALGAHRHDDHVGQPGAAR